MTIIFALGLLFSSLLLSMELDLKLILPENIEHEFQCDGELWTDSVRLAAVGVASGAKTEVEFNKLLFSERKSFADQARQRKIDSCMAEYYAAIRSGDVEAYSQMARDHYDKTTPLPSEGFYGPLPSPWADLMACPEDRLRDMIAAIVTVGKGDVNNARNQVGYAIVPLVLALDAKDHPYRSAVVQALLEAGAQPGKSVYWKRHADDKGLSVPIVIVAAMRGRLDAVGAFIAKCPHLATPSVIESLLPFAQEHRAVLAFLYDKIGALAFSDIKNMHDQVFYLRYPEGITWLGQTGLLDISYLKTLADCEAPRRASVTTRFADTIEAIATFASHDEMAQIVQSLQPLLRFKLRQGPFFDRILTRKLQDAALETEEGIAALRIQNMLPCDA